MTAAAMPPALIVAIGLALLACVVVAELWGRR